MNKKELLDLLRNCLNTEESAIPLYTKHINNTLFLSDFSEEDKKRVVDLLLMLSRESERHKKLFKVLIAKAEKDTKDVY